MQNDNYLKRVYIIKRTISKHLTNLFDSIAENVDMLHRIL